MVQTAGRAGLVCQASSSLSQDQRRAKIALRVAIKRRHHQVLALCVVLVRRLVNIRVVSTMASPKTLLIAQWDWVRMPTKQAAHSAGIAQVTHSRRRAATTSRTASVMWVIAGPMAGRVQPAARARTKISMGHQGAMLVR